MNAIDVRCPNGPQRLLARLLNEGELPIPTGDALWEFACGDCARLMRKGGRNVGRVLHRYDAHGRLVGTEVQKR